MVFRTIMKNKLTTFINITGLVVGLGGVLLIGLFVVDELSYDQHYKHKNRLYRLTSAYHQEGNIYHSAQTYSNMAPTLEQELPEIQAATRMLPLDETFLFSEEKAFKEKIIYTDSSFAKVFGLTLLIGNSDECLANPSSLLLSESMAIKIFGVHWQQKTILGEILSVDGKIPLTITGVFKYLPTHSHFRSDLFASIPLGFDWMDNNSKVYTYILANEQVNRNYLEEKLQTLSDKLLPSKESFIQINLQPITDIYLCSSLEDENGIHGNLNNIYTLLVIAFFLIVITVINFVNLYTANSLRRLKEIGVRKALGALSRQLQYQFLLETAFITLTALGIALIGVIFFLPTFNELTAKHLSPASLLHQDMVFLIVGIMMVISLPTGFYPSFYLSAMKTTEAVKGLKNKTTEIIGVRKGLVMLQFTISCIMIVLSIVAYKQMELINNQSLGFDKENTIAIANPYMLGSTENVIRFRNELLAVPGVAQVSITGYTPSQNRWGSPLITFPDKDVHSSYSYPAHWLTVDEGFIQTMGIQLTEGRNFNENHAHDKESIIVNEKAVNQFHLNVGGKNPVGSMLSFKDEGRELYQNFTVIGVVRDFNFGSLHEPIQPLIMKIGYHRFEMALRLSPQYARQEVINQVASIWKKNLPLIPFEYASIKNRFDNLHKPDKTISKVFSAFCLLTVIMSALGLFGIVTYTIANRTKEIGIRKVLGASIMSILVLLSKEYIKLILVSIAIAIPVANYFSSEWLNNFAFRTEVSW